MDAYLISLGVSELSEEVTFYILQDLDELAQAYVRVAGWRTIEKARDTWETGIAVAGQGWIVLNPANEWFANAPRESQMRVVAHELYHTWQHGLSGLSQGSGLDDVPPGGPRWLTEGIAEFSAYRAMSDIGVLSYEAERNSKEPWGFVRDGKYVDKPLSQMETWNVVKAARGNTYSYFLLAAELLASRAGEKALIHYYTLTQPGTTWQQAFEAAFGMTVDEFYDLFEEHRAAGFPEVEIPKSVGE